MTNSHKISKKFIRYTSKISNKGENFMNILLIFFALPLATIILACVLQKLIKCPILVAAIFFAIYLIVAFAVFDATFLIAAIVYTFLAYVTAAIVRILCWFFRNCSWSCNCSCSCNNQDKDCCCRRANNTTNNVLTLSDANETVSLSNRNGCTCRVTCRNNNTFNNGYNRGYNNGYDNGYNNAFDFCNDNGNNQNTCNQDLIAATNNIATAINNNFGCCCRRRCR